MEDFEKTIASNIIRVELTDLLSKDDPSSADSLDEKFPEWINEIEKVLGTNNIPRLFELAEELSDKSSIETLHAWAAAGIFFEFLEGLTPFSPEKEAREKKRLLLKSIDAYIHSVFEGSARYSEIRKKLLGLIENKLDELTQKIGISYAKPSKEDLDKRRQAIIGQSPLLTETLLRASKTALYDIHVLLTGETGVGKELLAAMIHELSRRRGRPFISVNCAAFSAELLESELFGHEKGAFTGAATAKTGLVEAAHGGTLFLDEIGDLAPQHQAKMLRFLQDGGVRRVGGLKEKKVDVRVISATNKDLSQETQGGKFREDLFYRIATISVHMPPLRERPEDIPELAQHFLDMFSKSQSLPKLTMTMEATRKLKRYSWPGNIRELQNVVQESAVFRASNTIGLPDLPKRLFGDETAETKAVGTADPFLSSLASAGAAASSRLDPDKLIAYVKSERVERLHNKPFRAFLHFLIESGGFSFRLKDVVDYLVIKKIGTQQSRPKLARKAIEESGLTRDNQGKTKKRLLRARSIFLKAPFDVLLQRLDEFLTDKGIAPWGRFVFEDFFLERFDEPFTERSLQGSVGVKTSLDVAALKRHGCPRSFKRGAPAFSQTLAGNRVF